MSETLRERVAYALYNREGRPPESLRWDAISDQMRQPWLLDADAALAVIREHLQSDAVVERMALALHDRWPTAYDWIDTPKDGQDKWRADARAALAAAVDEPAA